MTYLWRHPKSGVYYFRRAVPDELRHAIGKTMVKKSLGTKDVRIAKTRAHPIAMQTDTEFVAAKKNLDAPPRSELSQHEIEHLAAAHLHHQLAADEERRLHGQKEDDDLYKSIKAQL